MFCYLLKYIIYQSISIYITCNWLIYSIMVIIMIMAFNNWKQQEKYVSLLYYQWYFQFTFFSSRSILKFVKSMKSPKTVTLLLFLSSFSPTTTTTTALAAGFNFVLFFFYFFVCLYYGWFEISLNCWIHNGIWTQVVEHKRNV